MHRLRTAFAFIFRGLSDTAFSVFAPPQCRFCRSTLLGHKNPFLCDKCAAAVEWIGEGACRGCGFPAGPYASLGESCRHCRGKKLNLTAAAAVARYRGGARSMVLALKFRGETEMVRPMAALMALRLEKTEIPRPDWVVPVPLYPKRVRMRGFNQAELLAAAVAKRSGFETRTDVLVKTVNAKPQSLLKREERFANASGAYAASEEMTGKSVLLVDDVMTTGATLADCARACRAAGAKRVYALVFAR